MAPELQELLRAAAHEPGEGADLEDIARRAGGLRRTRRATAAGVLVVAAVSTFAAVSLVMAERPRNVDFIDRLPATGQADTTPAPAADAESPWQPLPPSPLSPRTDAVAVWTGTEVLLWGGMRTDPSAKDSAADQGAAYDPRQGAWRDLFPAPFASGLGTPAVWTGREMIVLGARPGQPIDIRSESPLVGSDDVGGVDRSRPVPAMAAYDPTADAWRTTAEPPRPIPPEPSAVWTGQEVLLWGGYGEADGVASDLGLAYDPTDDTWRELSSAPIAGRYDHGALWTGREMLVWGGYGIRREDGFGPAGDGAAYDPAMDSWRVLPAAPLSARFEPNTVWTGTQMLVLGGFGDGHEFLGDAAAFDPATDTWTTVAQPPRKGYQMLLPTPDGILARGRGGDLSGAKMQKAALYVPAEDKWVLVPDTEAVGDEGGIGVVTDQEVIVWGGGYPNGNEGASMSFPLLEVLARAEPVVTPTEPTTRRTEEESRPTAPVQQAPRLWPLLNVDAPWRDDASATAEAFGRQVLGWSNAKVVDGEPSEDGRFGSRLTLEGAGSVVGLTVHPTRDGTDYAVTEVHVANAAPFDVIFQASIRKDRAQIRFLPPRIEEIEPTPSAELILRYGEDTAGATTTEWPAVFDVDLPFPIKRPGSLLILIRDEQGKVIGAQGIGLPPGDVVTTTLGGPLDGG